MPVRGLAFALLLLGWAGGAGAQEATAVIRQNIYTDSDRTQVLRSFAAASAAIDTVTIAARASVDIVSSASIDVRSSPVFDAVSSASTVAMSDRRIETSIGPTWNDGRGHSIGGSFVYATENDYRSIGGSLQASWDIFDRNTTILGGGNFNHNLITSVVDSTFNQTMDEVGFSLGLAQVLSPNDAIRVRYDGSHADGYQASPYRSVRFGDWTAHIGPQRTIVFTNTMGPARGLPETEPMVRDRHAVVAEWLHGLGDSIGLAAKARISKDTWGVESATLSADLRYAAARGQLRLGYRFYLQGAADFYQPKYLMPAESYTYFTSDKELGKEVGHAVSLGLSFFFQDRAATGLKTQLDAQLEILHYEYPDFVLIDSRTSFFGEIGLRFEL